MLPPVPSDSVRILAVAELYPWPTVDGYRQRLDHMLRGLAQAGSVELFCLAEPHDVSDTPEVDVVDRVVTAAKVERSASEWMGDWIRGDHPRRMLGIDWTEAHRELGAWGPEVDLIWYSHIDSWAATSDLFPGVPSIVDFDNLENLLLRLRRRSGPHLQGADSPTAMARGIGRWGTSRAFDLVDERRWTRIQQRCSESVDKVVVCSTLDIERSGLANAVAVPNGSSEVPGADSDRRPLRGGVPTMLFVGALDYEPNTDAVLWFIDEVLPRVRSRIPEARLRVVGRGADALGLSAIPPGVEMVGEVADLQPELEAADVSVVPIRLGAGTRLKVIEAMANHIPIVTTAVGCEGIALSDGVHALIADDPRSFADRCLGVLMSGEHRQKLADQAAELFMTSYRWSSVEAKVAELAREVAGGQGSA